MSQPAPGPQGMPRSPLGEDVRRELETLARLGRKYMWQGAEVHRYLQDRGVLVTTARFYENVPLVSEIEASFEYDARGRQLPIYADPSVFSVPALRGYFDEIAPFAAEFRPPLMGDVDNPAGYFWKNPAFSYSDAVAYYCAIRSRRPKRVIEIGSGFSTLVALQALERNGQGELVCYEPFPRAWLEGHLRKPHRLIRRKIQDVDPAEFAAGLAAGDIVFIDSTHTVKTGSDCLYLYLCLLPSLSQDVFVHAHDIHLPFAFPMQVIFDKRIHWTEQYLLYALLLDNPRASVRFSSRYAVEVCREQVAALMHGQVPPGGGSIWFDWRRRA